MPQKSQSETLRTVNMETELKALTEKVDFLTKELGHLANIQASANELTLKIVTQLAEKEAQAVEKMAQIAAAAVAKKREAEFPHIDLATAFPTVVNPTPEGLLELDIHAWTLGMLRGLSQQAALCARAATKESGKRATERFAESVEYFEQARKELEKAKAENEWLCKSLETVKTELKETKALLPDFSM